MIIKRNDDPQEASEGAVSLQVHAGAAYFKCLIIIIIIFIIVIIIIKIMVIIIKIMVITIKIMVILISK